MSLKSSLILILLVVKTYGLFAQNLYPFADEAADYFESLEVLPDKNYSFEQILKDSSLHFTKHDDRKYYFRGVSHYWVRFTVKNTSAYSLKAYLSPFPNFHNILYSYDAEKKQWITTEAGLEIINGYHKNSIIPCIFGANLTDTFFLKIKVSPLDLCTLIRLVCISK